MLNTCSMGLIILKIGSMRDNHIKFLTDQSLFSVLHGLIKKLYEEEF